jgi:hypothetical protein
MESNIIQALLCSQALGWLEEEERMIAQKLNLFGKHLKMAFLTTYCSASELNA